MIAWGVQIHLFAYATKALTITLPLHSHSLLHNLFDEYLLIYIIHFKE